MNFNVNINKILDPESTQSIEQKMSTIDYDDTPGKSLSINDIVSVAS